MLNFFNRSTRVVGIDIKNDHIRFVEVLKSDSKDRITAYGEIIPESPIFESGDIADPTILLQHLKAIKKEIRTHDCAISLPEDQVKFLRLAFHKVKRSSAREEISMFLQSKGVMTFEEDILSLRDAGEVGGKTEYDILISKKALIKKYKEIFGAVHLRARKFMIPGRALIDSLVPLGSTTSFLLVSADEKVANIAAYDPAGLPAFYHGDASNSSIISNLNRIYIDWYDAKKEKVDHVFFVGSRASDQVFLDYVSRETRIHISRGNIFVNIELDRERVPIITKEDSYKYAVALGLAIS